MAKLEAAGRADWVLEACDELRQKGQSPVQPQDAWLRLKDARGLKGKGAVLLRRLLSGANVER